MGIDFSDMKLSKLNMVSRRLSVVTMESCKVKIFRNTFTRGILPPLGFLDVDDTGGSM